MGNLRPRIHDKENGLDYVLVGDYYIPDLRLDAPKEKRTIGKWVQSMGSIQSRAEELVLTEIVYE